MNSVTTDPPSSQAFPDPIHRIIPSCSLTYMSGASGVGKTIMLAQMVAAMRAGRPFCGHQTNPPTEICIIAADRDWSTYALAFKHAGFEDIKRYVLAEDKDFRPKDWKRTEALQFFDRALNLLNPLQGAFVIVDPVSPLFVQGKTNDNWDVAISSHYYRQQCRDRLISLLCTANVSKQRTEDTYVRPQDRIAGSGSFVAYSDTQIYLERDAEGILTFGWVPRAHAAEEFQFKFDNETGLFMPYQDDKKIGAPGLPAHLVETLKLVPELPGSITSPELAKQVAQERKVKRAMAFRSIQQLIERGLIVRDELGVVMRAETLSRPPEPPTEKEG